MKKLGTYLGTWTKRVCPYCDTVNWIQEKSKDYEYVQCWSCGDCFFPHEAAQGMHKESKKVGVVSYFHGCVRGDSFPRQ